MTYYNNNRSLMKAIASGHVEEVQRAIEQGGDVNCFVAEDGSSPLHLAALSGAGRAVVQLLLDHGAKPNAVDSSGNTPLHQATLMRNKAAALCLVKAGAHTAIRNDYGKIPLDNADRDLIEAANMRDEASSHVTRVEERRVYGGHDSPSR